MSYGKNTVDLSKFKHLDKEVELKAEAVELNELDNLRKYTKGFGKFYREGQGLQQKGERLKEELSDIISALYKYEELGKSMADDMAKDLVRFEKAVKSLGLNPKESKDFVDAEGAFKSYVEAANGFNRVAESLRKIR